MIAQLTLQDIGLHNGDTRAKLPVAFARHETFHPRFGWLKKGFDQACQNSSVFLRDDSTVRLGVGKNMVRSIRYWCDAFKLLEDDQPTEFGLKLLGNQGWDPYLEDPASLWLLHWSLLSAPCQATAWDFTFNHFRSSEFAQDDLLYQLCDYRDAIAPRISDSSLKKDISCILRMYVAQLSSKGSSNQIFAEDSLDCPFTELGLIRRGGDSRHFWFNIGIKPSLPAEIITYACLRHASQVVTGGSIPFANLLYGLGSPGSVFKLTESALYEAIEQVSHSEDRFAVVDAAGKLQFSFQGEPAQLAEDLLDRYYIGL